MPPGVALVAYLCVGYPTEFRPQPLLQEVGWKNRLPLDDLVHHPTNQAAVRAGGHASMTEPEGAALKTATDKPNTKNPAMSCHLRVTVNAVNV